MWQTKVINLFSIFLTLYSKYTPTQRPNGTNAQRVMYNFIGDHGARNKDDRHICIVVDKWARNTTIDDSYRF